MEGAIVERTADAHARSGNRQQSSRKGPLDGLLVLDMAQFLAGPFAALHLADLGARVIKIERPEGGDLARSLYLSDTDIGGTSTLFHAINRNKESLALDLKNPAHLEAIRSLVARADVLIQNFRPGVIERLGLGYDVIRKLNPRIVYASVSGFGGEGPWSRLPGQDLLAQARSGVMWLTGSADYGPVPVGLSIADMLAGHVLSKGILALLYQQARTGVGGQIETSLLEVLVDLQFELLTTYLNDGERPPQRAARHGANAYLAAPYGVYRTRDGWLALAMTPLDRLETLLDLPQLAATDGFTDRDNLLNRIAGRLAMRKSADWLALLEPQGIWVAEVLDWPALMQAESFRALEMLQTLKASSGDIRTTASPMRINGRRFVSHRSAPELGTHTAALAREFSMHL